MEGGRLWTFTVTSYRPPVILQFLGLIRICDIQSCVLLSSGVLEKISVKVNAIHRIFLSGFSFKKESDGEDAEDGEAGARGDGLESPQLVTDQPKPSTPPGVGSAGWDTTGSKPARPMPPGAQNMPIPMPPPPSSSANERTSLSQGDARLHAGEMPSRSTTPHLRSLCFHVNVLE
jgi:hypothetical protein